MIRSVSLFRLKNVQWTFSESLTLVKPCCPQVMYGGSILVLERSERTFRACLKIFVLKSERLNFLLSSL